MREFFEADSAMIEKTGAARCKLLVWARSRLTIVSNIRFCIGIVSKEVIIDEIESVEIQIVSLLASDALWDSPLVHDCAVCIAWHCKVPGAALFKGFKFETCSVDLI